MGRWLVLYLLMAVVNVAVAVYDFRRAHNKAAYTSTLTAAVTVIMVADWVVYGIFNLYRYHPSLSGSQVVDGSLGMLLADFIYVPAMTVLMLHRFPLINATVLSTFLFTAMEGLFLRAGLFTHHGWRLWLTAVLFPFYGAAIGFYFHAAQQRPAAPWTVALRKASLAYNGMALLALIYRMANLVYTNLHIVPEYMRNQSLGRFLTYSLVSGPLGYWVLAGARSKRGARLAAFVLIQFGLDWFLQAVNFQHFRMGILGDGIDALAQGAVLWGALLVDDWIGGLTVD